MTRTGTALAAVVGLGGLACLGGSAVGEQVKTPPTAKAPAPLPKAPAPPVKAPAQPAKAARVLVAPAMPVVEGDMIAEMEQQFVPQFRQLHRAELLFLRTTADLTRQQADKIAADGEAAVKAAARDYAKRARTGVDNGADPRQAIAAAVANSAKAHLTPDQLATYRQEVDLRTAARKRMIVTNLVVMMDNVLVLSADQRRQLTEVLTANWNDSWNQPQYFQMNGQYYPAMPDAKINPLLTEQQRAVWAAVPNKGNVRFGINFNMNMIDVEDVDWAEPPAKEGGDK